jgi:mycothiol synthase
MVAKTIEGLRTRAARIEDVEAVTDLLNACSVVDTGAPDTIVQTMRFEWESPKTNLETDSLLVSNGDGQPVAFASTFEGTQAVRTFGFGRVHPDYRGQGIGTALLAWMEERAQLSIAKAPADARVTLSQGIDQRNVLAANLMKNNGFQFVRRFWRMQTDLTAPPPEPVWPEGLTLRTMDVAKDGRAVHDAIETAFSDHWGHMPWPYEEFEYYMLKDPTFDPTLVFLAMDGEQIAGVSFCFPRIDEDADMGWVGDLGVLREYRKHGLGLALLHHSFGEFYRRGKARAGLGVDSESLTGATRLYERAGMHAERTWDRYEKELRPGKDYTVQTLAE